MSGLLDFLQSASNSAASNVSAPIDAIAWLLRKAGIPVPEQPIGGSDWMAQRGLTRPVEQGVASVAGETAGLLSPVMLAAKAPQAARGLLQMAENAAAPGTLGSQRGALVFPREQALKEAQRNAAKPVSEGGLGLRPDNTAAERARAMGFETAPKKMTYHGSRENITGEIDPSRSDFGFHTGTVDQAEHRLKAFAPPTAIYPEGANIVPLMKSKYANMLRATDEGSFHADALAPQLAKKGIVSKEWAKKVEKEVAGDWRKAKEFDDILRMRLSDQGIDGLVYSNAQEGIGKSYAFNNPSVIRSPFAAFDPAKRDSADILATLAALGIGVPMFMGTGER